ncbi:hypothetical protein TRFO_23903 [Tritrichomonas foetus]|uniref:Uncharacterized protein n=1 Tax=Tritrichomonas foetus TaxID=1144522 RepID=A0A1J4KEA4_9EUKA|nr:hypothetical protein TRFO_23903 [Tritrichomonas foetus]|eukprot:OHT07789.1 hypothetical protein TRFO_23903 [Tritrichomonas foetus]
MNTSATTATNASRKLSEKRNLLSLSSNISVTSIVPALNIAIDDFHSNDKIENCHITTNDLPTVKTVGIETNNLVPQLQVQQFDIDPDNFENSPNNSTKIIVVSPKPDEKLVDVVSLIPINENDVMPIDEIYNHKNRKTKKVIHRIATRIRPKYQKIKRVIKKPKTFQEVSQNSIQNEENSENMENLHITQKNEYEIEIENENESLQNDDIPVSEGSPITNSDLSSRRILSPSDTKTRVDIKTGNGDFTPIKRRRGGKLDEIVERFINAQSEEASIDLSPHKIHRSMAVKRAILDAEETPPIATFSELAEKSNVNRLIRESPRRQSALMMKNRSPKTPPSPPSPIPKKKKNEIPSVRWVS